jgi:hypothetical protein
LQLNIEYVIEKEIPIMFNRKKEESIKEKVYEEISTTYRFFLGWRHAAFAGDIIAIYGILTLTYSVFTENSDIAWVVPAIGFPIGILLWIIDKRTRDLYHATTNAGKQLEGEVGGFFTELKKKEIPEGFSPFCKPSHSGALNLLFFGTSFILFVLAIYLYIEY